VTRSNVAALGIVVAAAVVGWTWRRRGGGCLDDALEQLAATAVASHAWDRIVSPTALYPAVLMAFVPLGAFVVLAIYPDPAVLIDEMRPLRDDAWLTLNSGTRPQALAVSARWEALARKLPVSVVLRRGWAALDERRTCDDLLDRLEAFRRSLDEGEPSQIRATFRRLDEAFTACRRILERSDRATAIGGSA
jgi:hypothetical protein